VYLVKADISSLCQRAVEKMLRDNGAGRSGFFLQHCILRLWVLMAAFLNKSLPCNISGVARYERR
jgi:hypothetical protein